MLEADISRVIGFNDDSWAPRGKSGGRGGRVRGWILLFWTGSTVFEFAGGVSEIEGSSDGVGDGFSG
jgi:hypothetical protein